MRVANKYVVMLAAGACGLLISAASASAEDLGPGPYGNNGAYPNEPASGASQDVSGSTSVTVAVPPYRYPWPNKIGAPVENVSLSRLVRYDDLDLRSPEGVGALRSRIRLTARLACSDLDFFYPVSITSNQTCFSAAVDDAMYRADMAIRVANATPVNAATEQVASVEPQIRHGHHHMKVARASRHARLAHARKKSAPA